MSLLNNIKIRLIANKIGIDEFGNSYYEEKRGRGNIKKRFIIYNGVAEASKIPAEWHSWIHYTTNNTPNSINTHKYSWQKIHLPNLTGTKFAYFPFGSLLRGGKRHKIGADYQAWNPNKKN
jgi:NADH:ubiquinone oxidoreductase subunit